MDQNHWSLGVGPSSFHPNVVDLPKSIRPINVKMADAERLLWFMSLKRIVANLGRGFAPIALRSRLRINAPYRPIESNSDDFLGRGTDGPIPSVKRSRPSTQQPWLNPRISPKTLSGATFGLANGRTNATLFSNPAPRTLKSLGWSIAKPMARRDPESCRTIQPRLGTTYGTRSVNSIIPEQYSSLAPSRQMSLARPFTASSQGPIRSPNDDSATYSRFQNAGSLSNRLISASSSEWDQIRPSDRSQADVSFADIKGRLDGKPNTGRTPSVSTLHLDGSALGRWAIQHLERTLGKPTTGMTGVDPRATLPRSRVAPF